MVVFHGSTRIPVQWTLSALEVLGILLVHYISVLEEGYVNRFSEIAV